MVLCKVVHAKASLTIHRKENLIIAMHANINVGIVFTPYAFIVDNTDAFMTLCDSSTVFNSNVLITS